MIGRPSAKNCSKWQDNLKGTSTLEYNALLVYGPETLETWGTSEVLERVAAIQYLACYCFNSVMYCFLGFCHSLALLFSREALQFGM
jgi:hypothetical protein